MSGECSVGILIDLCSPDSDSNENDNPNSDSNENDNPNESFSLTECIEMARSDQINEEVRRLSHTLITSVDKEERILKDVTDKVVCNSHLEENPEMLIQDEIYDFDLNLSPDESSIPVEPEEEVFFGPVGFTEKLVSSVVPSSEFKPMSPLNPQQLAEIVKEAHSIAYHISNMALSPSVEEKAFQPLDILANKRKSPTKPRQRKGTFEMEKPVQLLLSDNTQIKIPCVDDQENVPPDANSVKSEKCIPSVNVKKGAELTEKMSNKEETGLKVSDLKSKNDDKSVSGTVKNKSTESKLKRPSKLARMSKNSSYTLLPKMTSTEDLNRMASDIPNNEMSCESDADSFVSDKSDIPRSKLPTVKSSFPLMPTQDRKRQFTGDSDAGSETSDYSNRQSLYEMSKSVESIDESLLEKRRQYSGGSEANSDTSSIASDFGDLSGSRLPVRNMTKTSIPSRKSGIPGISAKKQIPVVKTGIPPANSGIPPPKSKMPTTRASIGKLINPGLTEKSKLAFPRGKPKPTVSGPVKALKPVGPGPKIGSGFNKPEISANAKSKLLVTPPVKQYQKIGIKSSVPDPVNRLPVNMRTPVKSSCSSTSSTDTPSRRRSCLPTPNKQRLSSANSIPPSPLTNRSSVSSNASTGSRKLHLSDGSESPVFTHNGKTIGYKNRSATDINDESPSGMQPTRHPVQNTPDIPKRSVSAWSPVNRNRFSVDAHFQCTKRINTQK